MSLEDWVSGSRFPLISFFGGYAVIDAGVIWLATKDLKDSYPVSISLSTPISE
jgi:hypothetical protein